MKIPQQFEIYNVDLEPRKGSEQGGLRPCLILQSNGANKFARTFLIAPFTSKKIDYIHLHEVLVYKSKKNGLLQNSKVKLSQIRVIDKTRFVQKIGRLELDYEPAIFQAIDVMIDRWGDFRNQKEV